MDNNEEMAVARTVDSGRFMDWFIERLLDDSQVELHS